MIVFIGELLFLIICSFFLAFLTYDRYIGLVKLLAFFNFSHLGDIDLRLFVSPTFRSLHTIKLVYTNMAKILDVSALGWSNMKGHWWQFVRDIKLGIGFDLANSL